MTTEDINIKCRKQTLKEHHVDAVTWIIKYHVSGVANRIGYCATLLCAMNAAALPKQDANTDITGAVKTKRHMKSQDVQNPQKKHVLVGNAVRKQ